MDGVRENKQCYAEAEAKAALKPKASMAGFTSYMMGTFPEGQAMTSLKQDGDFVMNTKYLFRLVSKWIVERLSIRQVLLSSR